MSTSETITLVIVVCSPFLSLLAGLAIAKPQVFFRISGNFTAAVAGLLLCVFALDTAYTFGTYAQHRSDESIARSEVLAYRSLLESIIDTIDYEAAFELDSAVRKMPRSDFPLVEGVAPSWLKLSGFLLVIGTFALRVVAYAVSDEDSRKSQTDDGDQRVNEP